MPRPRLFALLAVAAAVAACSRNEPTSAQPADGPRFECRGGYMGSDGWIGYSDSTCTAGEQ